MASLWRPTDANQPVINDPIRFDIKSNTRQIVIGKEIELSISARLMTISPNLMFFLPGSNAYTLRMLLPAGFQQTGGNLTEFVTGALDSPSQSEVTYTLRGFFTSTTENTCFRLLRSHGQATSQSLFVEKATLCLPVHSPDKQGAGRTAATNSSFNWCVEAENGSGNRGVSSSGQASAGQYTGSFGNNTEYMTYTISGVPSAGSYALHLWYATGDNPQLGIVVNGNLQTSSVSSTSNWAGPFAENTVAISLQAGNNSLQIQGNGGGSFNIDRLCIDGGDGGGGCTPPSLSLGTPSCNGTTNYSVSFSAQAGSTVSSSAGSVQGNQVVNIPTGTNVTITASLNGCSSQQTANSPTCNSGGNPNPPTGTCSVSNPQSTLDDADCNGIRGWALDVNNFNQTQTIDIYIDGVKTYSGISANADRPDVANYYNNPAARYHGFNYTFPSDAPWKNGQNHTISVRMCGVNSDLAGSPRTANGCSGGTPNPPSSSCGTGSGLTGFYTNSTDLSTNLVSIRTDAQINFIWGNDSPIPNVVNADGFSVRWYGQIEAPVSGNYTFKTNNDDGTRVWVNGQIIIDDWNGHAPTWQQGSIYLNAGQKYYIDMVFVDYWGGAQAQLFWEYPGQPMQIVPSCRLYTPIIPTQYNPDEITNITNSPLPYGFSSVSLTNLTFFLRSYTGNVVDYSVPYSPPPAPEEPIDPIFHPGSTYPTLPYGGGGGGGSIPGPWNNPGVPRFNIQTGLTPTEIALNKFYANMLYKGISFTTDEKAVIARYPNLMNNITIYVNQYGSKPDFVVLMDKYLEDTYSFVTSPAERAILANRSWQDQITFRGNAINASLEAVTRFGVFGCQDNPCNAYRHAFFNALNAQSFTVAVARQLGQAREGNRMIDPATLLPANFICNPAIDPDTPAAYMDLFNNEWGYRAFNQFQSQGGNLSAIIQGIANNGSLRNAPGCP